MLLITNFVIIRVVAGRSRKLGVRPHAVPGVTMLIPMTRPCRATPCPLMSLSELDGRGMAKALHVMFESDTAVRCKSKLDRQNPLTLNERSLQGNGVGTAWYV
jgi:hypothetical protein